MTDPAPALPAARRRDHAALIGAGVLALPVANALKLLGNLGTYDSVGYGVPAGREAAVASGPGYLLGNLIGSIFPTIAGIFGAIALFAYLVGWTTQRRLLSSALTCSIVGAGITLPALGVVTYAIPALAHQYQGGDRAAMTTVNNFFLWPWGAIFYAAVLFPIGLIMLCVMLWRSTLVPRLAIAGCALAAVLISIPVPLHSVRLAGGVLGLVAGGWLALAVRRDLAASRGERTSVCQEAGNLDE